MQDIFLSNEPTNGLRIATLSIEDKQNLVDVFAWLIREDKKQNPEQYTDKVLNND